LLGTLIAAPEYALIALAGVVGLVGVHAAYLFAGGKFTWSEVALTTVLLPLVPLVRTTQYLRGLATWREGDQSDDR
jgi:hypothetical protein